MTKKTLQQKYSEWNRGIGAMGERKNEIFHTLQEMCEEKGDGHRWCSLEKLTEVLVKRGYVFQVMPLVEEYYSICGPNEALRDFALATNNFEI